MPLREKQRLFFLYEKRIRELSNAEKVYEYFASDKRDDGAAYMRPQVSDVTKPILLFFHPTGQLCKLVACGRLYTVQDE